jgi:DNA-binding IclR family transcriptional regulator
MRKKNGPAFLSKPDPDLEKWCKVLAAIAVPVEAVPPGWLTIQQLSKQTKTPVATLQKKLKQLINAGQASRQMFRIQLKTNARPVPHYKLK